MCPTDFWVNPEMVNMTDWILSDDPYDFLLLSRQELILSEVKNGPAQVPHINWQNYGNIYYDFGKDSPSQIMIKPGNLKQQVEDAYWIVLLSLEERYMIRVYMAHKKAMCTYWA